MKISNSRKEKTIINTFFGSLNRICNIFLSFLFRSIFIYSLGVEYAGVSALFTDILTVLSFAELGIGTAIATALYVPLRDDDRKQIRKLMLFYKNAYRIISVVILCVGLTIIPFLDYLIKDVPNVKESISFIFVFYILKTSASYLLIYKTTILIADQKQYMVKIREIICSFVRYIIEAIVLLILKNFILYLLLELIITILQNLYITAVATKKYPYAFEKSDDRLGKTEVRNLLKDIKSLAMYKISGTIGNSIDNILVSSFLGTIQIGILSNYTLIQKQVEQMLNQFFQALTPSIGNLAAELEGVFQYNAFNRIFYLSFVVVNFCASSLFVLYRPFINLWLGPEFLLDDTIAFIIAFDFFLYVLLQAIASFRTANGLFIKGQYRPLIMACLNIILSIVFIKKFGIFGTIFATSVCRLLTQWYDPFILFKYVFKTNFKKFYFRYIFYILIFLISASVTYGISELFYGDSELLRFIYVCCCCVFIPNFIAMLFTFKLNEFRYFAEFIKSQIR